MTEVAFHFNVSDRLAYTCRLLRKALASKVQVLVVAPADLLRRLDVLLWTFSGPDFIPHAKAGDDPRVLSASPVLLLESSEDVPHQQVLLNLGHEVPAGFEKFARLIEIVGLDDEDRQQARSRWKDYANAGHAITRHDLALRENA